jgi:predicted nuclease of predicted toxin-antitoxin system
LIDACVPRALAVDLTAAGHDVECVENWPGSPGDDEVLAAARDAGRVLITLDKDFGELAIRVGHAHAGILRLLEMPLSRQSAICRTVLESYANDLQAGALVVASPGRVRIRAANID